MLDSSGNTVAKYVYDAWGNHVVLDASGNEIADSTHIGNLNPFRYRSYYYDTETELYFLQSRYYDSQIGRFITIDDHSYLDPDTINGINLYAYCFNNPVMASDPSGHWPKWLKAVTTAVVAVAVVAVAAVATVATGGLAAPVVAGAIVGAGVGGVSSAAMQYAETGSVDISTVFTDMVVGAVVGALGGTAIGTLGMTIAGGATGFSGSVANDWINDRDIDLKAATSNAVLTAGFASLTGGGVQSSTIKMSSAAKSTLKTIARRTGSWKKGLTKISKNQLTRISKNAIKSILKSMPQNFYNSSIQYILFNSMS